MSDSVRRRRRQPTRLPHPWDSPGKNTGVGCHCLLQKTDYRLVNLEDEHFRISASHLLSTVENHVCFGMCLEMFLRDISQKIDSVLEIYNHCFFFNKVGRVIKKKLCVLLRIFEESEKYHLITSILL